MLIIGDVIMLVMWEGCPTLSFQTNKRGTLLTDPWHWSPLSSCLGRTRPRPTFPEVNYQRVWWELMMVSPFKPPKKWLEMMNPFEGNPISRWWFQICSNIFKSVTLILGEMIQFDRYVSIGWLNHQLGFYFFSAMSVSSSKLGYGGKKWKR